MAARKAVASDALCHAARQAGPSSAKFSRCIRSVPDAADSLGEAATYTQSGIQVSDRSRWTLSGDVYYDGSCQKAPTLSLASYAAAQVDHEGQLVAYLQGTVPSHLPQSSQAAEHYGRLAAVKLLEGPAVLYGDCKNVVVSARLSGVAAQDCRMYAGMRRAAVRSHKLHHVTADVKVKAHRDESEATSAEDLRRLRGNRFADELAKLAMNLHPGATERIVQANGDFKEMVTIARTMVATMRLWPPNTRQKIEDVPRAPSDATPKCKQTSHTWECKRSSSANAYFCTTCLTSTRDLRTYRIRHYQKCPGLCLSLAAIVAHGDAHQLVHTCTDPGE